MHVYSQIFIVVVIAVLALKIYLNQLQIQSILKNIGVVPHVFKATISPKDHQKAAKYNIAKLKLSQVENIVSSGVLVLFTLGGGIQWLNNICAHMIIIHPLSQGVMVIVLYTVINSMIGLPFSIYATFSIEQKFGFNNSTIQLFITDLVKGTILAAILGVPLIYLVLWLMQTMGNNWWLWVWIVIIAFNLLIMIIYPSFIAPIFNKFSLLSDVVLRNRITRLLEKCGFQSKGVFVMDGSKRSSHGNAYFTGFGHTKRIVFFDILMKQLNHDEIEAVLAHELGHFKKKHVLKQMVVSFALNFIILFIASLLLSHTIFYESLGVTTITTANGLILFMAIIGLMQLPFAPLLSYFSRKNEFEADDFAIIHSNKKHLINGLIKLYRDNASILTPNPLYVKFYYSHPPATVRIANLEHEH